MRFLSAQFPVPDEKYCRQQNDGQRYDAGQQQDEPKFGDELFDFLVVDYCVTGFPKQTYTRVVLMNDVIDRNECCFWLFYLISFEDSVGSTIGSVYGPKPTFVAAAIMTL